MKFPLLAAVFAQVASAHFQLQLSDPRGAFNEENEPTFCANRAVFFQLEGEGTFRLPLNLSFTNATGLTNCQNAAIQILFNGGDLQLYQCSDLTLFGSFSLSQSIDAICTNTTSNSTDSNSESGSGSSSALLTRSLSLSRLVVCIVGTMVFLFM
ncbi:hypothetical protein DFS33DRAFT_1309143 [Desarmillaria ectypa]|nr:hypothetical protein DFS33DRAFT_1309143 [Desarmillaria ectypa]